MSIKTKNIYYDRSRPKIWFAWTSASRNRFPVDKAGKYSIGNQRLNLMWTFKKKGDG